MEARQCEAKTCECFNSASDLSMTLCQMMRLLTGRKHGSRQIQVLREKGARNYPGFLLKLRLSDRAIVKWAEKSGASPGLDSSFSRAVFQ